MSQPFEIEVVFAAPDAQLLRSVQVTEGCTAAEAIELASLTAHWQPVAEPARPLSCFGRLISSAYRVSAGDRIEILRPLFANAKDQRHQRVKAARQRRARGL